MTLDVPAKNLECCPYYGLNGDMSVPSPAIPDDLDGAPGPYDAGPEGKDLWFLPDADPERDSLVPLLRADRPLFSIADWRKAEGEQAALLADVGFRLGILDERLRSFGGGSLTRLALKAAEELCWAQGDRIAADRLVLWMEMNLAGVQDDSQALARASWAARRLASPRAAADSGLGEGTRDLLGRRESGQEGAVADLVTAMVGAEALHPLTRGAFVFQAWRILGQEGAATGIEAAVLGARVSASTARGGAYFLPVGLAGLDGARGASPGEKLGAWLRSAERGLFAALMALERLSLWQSRAQAVLADLQGRTPVMLVDLFLTMPVVTAPLAEARVRAGRSTVQRNLDLMQVRSLIREITGQGRFRVWTVQT